MSEWISVEDRLPELEQVCITWIGEPLACKEGQEIQVGRYYEGDYEGEWGFAYYRSGFLGGYEVTHWMPLPEPPINNDIER